MTKWSISSVRQHKTRGEDGNHSTLSQQRPHYREYDRNQWTHYQGRCLWCKGSEIIPPLQINLSHQLSERPASLAQPSDTRMDLPQWGQVTRPSELAVLLISSSVANNLQIGRSRASANFCSVSSRGFCNIGFILCFVTPIMAAKADLVIPLSFRICSIIIVIHI